MIPADSREDILLRDGRLLEELVSHPGWLRFVELAHAERDKLIVETRRIKDREYQAGAIYFGNVLTGLPIEAIRRKDALLAQLMRREQEASASSKTSREPDSRVRQSPQAV